MHELFEELNAFDVHWQTHYRSIRAAAEAADVMGLYWIWRQTDEGKRYGQRFDAPDYTALIRADDTDSLPYTLDNIGNLESSDDE